MNKNKKEWKCNVECGIRTCWPICGNENCMHLRYWPETNSSEEQDWWLETYANGAWRKVNKDDGVTFSWNGEKLNILERNNLSLSDFRIAQKNIIFSTVLKDNIPSLLKKVSHFIYTNCVETEERNNTIHTLDRIIKTLREKDEESKTE